MGMKGRDIKRSVDVCVEALMHTASDMLIVDCLLVFLSIAVSEVDCMPANEYSIVSLPVLECLSVYSRQSPRETLYTISHDDMGYAMNLFSTDF